MHLVELSQHLPASQIPANSSVEAATDFASQSLEVIIRPLTLGSFSPSLISPRGGKMGAGVPHE